MATSPNLTVGFVGLGSMGLRMARNLVRAGYMVKGYDINPQSVEAFAQAGGIAAGTAIRATSATPSAAAVRIIGTGTTSRIAGDRLIDYLLTDLRV